MDVDVNENLNEREHIFSSCNDLSTQEVQEVIVDLFGSPQDPICGQVQYIRVILFIYDLIHTRNEVILTV